MFLMISHFNTDVLKNFVLIPRMHGDTYNRNPSVEAVRFTIRKNDVEFE